LLVFYQLPVAKPRRHYGSALLHKVAMTVLHSVTAVRVNE
jgi:hypothetical protein